MKKLLFYLALWLSTPLLFAQTADECEPVNEIKIEISSTFLVPTPFPITNFVLEGSDSSEAFYVPVWRKLFQDNRIDYLRITPVLKEYLS